MKTKRGIYYNLEESEYYYRVGTYKFCFSSKQYRDKFIRLQKDYVKSELYKIVSHYENLYFDARYYPIYFCYLLYSKIEKRGFLVYNEKEKITKLPEFRLTIKE